MIICPVQNTAKFSLAWVQVRPRISQGFGENPAVYKQFGLVGHNGIDFAIPIGTHIYSPIAGKITAGDEGSSGYGKYIKITNDTLEVTIGHLSVHLTSTGLLVHAGDLIALSGNSGFSTGPHTHITVKNMKNGKVLNYDNGYKGAIDFKNIMLNWKGTLQKDTL